MAERNEYSAPVRAVLEPRTNAAYNHRVADQEEPTRELLHNWPTERMIKHERRAAHEERRQPDLDFGEPPALTATGHAKWLAASFGYSPLETKPRKNDYEWVKEEVAEDVLADVGVTVDHGASLMTSSGVPDIFGWLSADDWIFIEAKSPKDRETDSQFSFRVSNLDNFPIFHMKIL